MFPLFKNFAFTVESLKFYDAMRIVTCGQQNIQSYLFSLVSHLEHRISIRSKIQFEQFISCIFGPNRCDTYKGGHNFDVMFRTTIVSKGDRRFFEEGNIIFLVLKGRDWIIRKKIIIASLHSNRNGRKRRRISSNSGTK